MGNRDGATPMNRWYGKLIGVLLGVALLRFNPLLGALIGLLIGHAFDSGWFKGPTGRSQGQDDQSHRDDPYAVLGLTSDASTAEIERAYRRLISRHHPDRINGDVGEQRQHAETRAREINSAYDRIKALRKRSDHP